MYRRQRGWFLAISAAAWLVVSGSAPRHPQLALHPRYVAAGQQRSVAHRAARSAPRILPRPESGCRARRFRNAGPVADRDADARRRARPLLREDVKDFFPHGRGGVRRRRPGHPPATDQGHPAASVPGGNSVPARSEIEGGDMAGLWAGVAWWSGRCGRRGPFSRAARPRNRRRGGPRSVKALGAATTRCPTSRPNTSATTPSGSTPITASIA